MEFLPPGYTYLKQSLNDETTLLFIKEVKDELLAKKWLEDWSNISKITWRKRTTYPRSGRHNCYKVDLKCQHAADKRVKRLHTKKTGCTATLQIKIAGEKEQGEWPATMTIRGAHNHPIENPAALKYRDMSAEVREKLIALFHKGYDPSSALHCIKTDLLLQHGKEYYKFACDGKFVPSLSIVRHLFYNEFSKEYGNFSGETMLMHLDEMLNKYTAETAGKAVFSYTKDKNNYFVVVCTPLMVRAQERIVQSNEIILVDSSGGMDKEKHRLYFFITPTAAGGVPLAAIITDSEKKIVFDEAVQKLKQVVPESSSLKQGGPQVFMTDNDLKERDCLKKNFPNSKLLLCQFHILKAVWAWLLKQSHNILNKDRQEIYFLFKKVLYAKTENQFFQNHEMLLTNKTVNKYDNFKEYYKKLLCQKEDWAACFRSGLFIRGSNTTNYVEVMFRIMKECILNRVMAFNLNQFIDFILTRFEIYYQKRLTDFCHDRYSSYTVRNMQAIQVKEFSILEKTDSDIYHLYDSLKKERFIVDGICSCVQGNTGMVCEHSAFLLRELHNTIRTNFNFVSTEIKKTMFYVANGTMPPTEWFQPLISIQPSCSYVSSAQVSNDIQKSNFYQATVNESIVMELPKLNEVEKESLKNFYKRIDEGLENDPENFVPAVRKMLNNISSTKTDSSFLSALHTFGKYQGFQSVKCASKLLKRSRSHSKTIGVQPTALGRRVKNFTGQKIVKAGRPKRTRLNESLQHHDYTTFGYLPNRKKKAPHNLQECVMDNKSLGD